jgi:hypothetical protein
VRSKKMKEKVVKSEKIDEKNTAKVHRFEKYVRI